MLTGTNADRTLHQSGMDWIIDARAVRGTVADLTVKEDASSMTVRAMAKGASSDISTLISRQALRSDLLAAGFPLLDSVRGYNTTIQDEADGYARSDLAANDGPMLTWTTRLAWSDSVMAMQPGDWCTVRVGDDRVLVEAGDHRARIASMSGDIGGSWVDVTMMPVPE